MNPLLEYSPDDDNRFFGSLKFKLGNLNLQISAITLAGKREVGSPQKPNEDAFSITVLNGTL